MSRPRQPPAAVTQPLLDLADGVTFRIQTGALERLTRTCRPELIDAFGIGFETAAEMLVTGGDTSTGSIRIRARRRNDRLRARRATD